LFFTTVFAAVLALFCYLVFFDARQYSTLPGWVTFTSLIVFIGFVFWLIFLLRFNVFKRFGNWHLLDGLKSFGLYFICLGAMGAVFYAICSANKQG
jgi:amino acid transporter